METRGESGRGTGRAEAPDPAREEAKRPAKMLVRSLADIINRLIDDGAKLSDDEHETLDRAAAYAGE